MGSCENTMKLEALPKGFRFRPTDEELISHYLRLKINGCHSAVDVVPEVDVCKWEPWDLPALSVIKSDDLEWFFFCPRDRKYPNGYRSNRATEAGYWKATGKDRTIKSRKSSPPGCSRSQSIGLKKTLVFYKGRAPKGERTNWIMHEYRATEPDLDGTGPGQGDYVLCRLFHKVDEKLGNSKFNEDEHTGSFPSTNKSSPEDVSSDLLREPALLDMQMIKEPEDIKKLWTDQAGCLTPTNLAPVESYASDANNHSVEETAMEVSRPLREVSMSEEAPYNQFDDKVLGTFQSHSYDDLSAPIASPFAADFGNERNGLHFQDGTSEPDASLSELWEDLQNDVNQFDEGSTGQRTHDKSESFIPSHVDGPEHAPFAICKGQISPSLSRVPSTDHSHSHYPVGEVDSSPVETFCDPNPTEDDSHLVSGTGIKIRSRMPRDRSRSINFAAQGTAPRRMRLWMSYGRERSKGEEHESRSLIRKTTKDIDRTSSEESEFANQNKETAKKCGPTPTKHGQNGGVKMASSMLSAEWPARQGSGYFKAYAVGIYVAIILSVVFLGMWICPRLHALRS